MNLNISISDMEISFNLKREIKKQPDSMITNYNGCYDSGPGEISEVDDECYAWSFGNLVCFDLLSGGKEEEEEVIEEETAFEQYILVSEHAYNSYNG